MDVLIRSTYEEMSRCAANIIAALVREKPNAVLGLATGATPIGTYRELVRMHREEGLDFSRVTTFNLDEYLGTVVLDEAAASKLALADHYRHVERLKAQYHIH